MINTLSILLYKSNGDFSTVHTASQAELEKELLCRSNDLRRKSCYVPKVVFKNECTLSIECSPAKCIYGHNLFEVSSTDLECFLGQLCLILEKLGIYTTVDKLRNGHCWRVDYAKLIHLPFPTDTVVDIFLHTTPHGKQKKYVTNYCKGGRAISNCLKRRKSTFYDKKAEFLSDRNNEKHTLKEVLHHIPGSLWRYEFSAKTAKEIKRELIKYDFSTDVTVSNLFDEKKAQRILLGQFSELSDSIVKWETPQLINYIRVAIHQLPKQGQRSLVYQLAIVLLVGILGVGAVSNMIEVYLGARQAQEFKREIKKVKIVEARDVCEFKAKVVAELQQMVPYKENKICGLVQTSNLQNFFSCRIASVLLAVVKQNIKPLEKFLTRGIYE